MPGIDPIFGGPRRAYNHDDGAAAFITAILICALSDITTPDGRFGQTHTDRLQAWRLMTARRAPIGGRSDVNGEAGYYCRSILNASEATL